MKKELNQWRTVGIAALGIVAAFFGLLVTGHYPSAGAQYGAFVSGVGTCVGAVALKAWGQHKANAAVEVEKAP